MRPIDADAFKDYIRSGYEEMKHLFNENLKVAALVTESFCKDIDEQPTIQLEPSQVAADLARIVENEKDMRVLETAQPERIRGRWIPVGGALYQCDKCGVVSLKRKFCSECGADMREVTE